MAAKKKKHKFTYKLSPAELLAGAESKLQSGHVDDALQQLRLAEKELKPRPAPGGKAMTLSPQLAVAQQALPPLLARALVARARATAGAQAQRDGVLEAVKYVPNDARYHTVLGLAHLRGQDVGAAQKSFAQAETLRPDDGLNLRAQALASLSAKQTKEAGETLQRVPETQRDARWQRLSALRALCVNSPVTTNDALLKGVAHLAAGERDAAQQQFNELPSLAQNPTRADAAHIATQFFYSGVLQFEATHHAAALGDWREALRLLQAHQLQLPWRDRLPAYLHQIAAQAATTDMTRAVECWKQALALDGNDRAALHNLSAVNRTQAMQEWKADRIEEAGKIWHDALKEKPFDEELLRCAAIVDERLGNKEGAVNHWRDLARYWRGQIKERANETGFKEGLQKLERHIIQLMMETDEPPQAIVNELEKVLKHDPNDHELRHSIADQLMELGKTVQALKHLDIIEKQQGVSAELLMRRAMAYEAGERYRDAFNTFERAVTLEPNNAVVRRGFVIFLGQEAIRATDRKDVKQAEEICRRQLALDATYSPALTHLAKLAFDQKRSAEGKELLNRAIAINPQDAKIHLGAGALYLNQGMKKEAEAAFKTARQWGSGPEIAYGIGVAYWASDDRKKAYKYFDEVAAEGPVEMTLDIAMHLVEDDDVKNALRYLDLAIKREPDNPIPHMVKAISMIGLKADPVSLLLGGFGKNKKLDDAVKELEEAERLMTGKPEYAGMLPEIRQMKQLFSGGGIGALLGGLGGLPFMLDDDDFDDDDFDDDDDFEPGFFLPPPTTRRRAQKAKPKKKR